jgi:hypothetical protein
MERRSFLQMLGVAFILPKINLEPLPEVTPAPATTPLGKALADEYLWPEGWHNVKCVNVEQKPSRLRDEDNFWFTLESLDGKHRCFKIFSPRAPAFMFEFLMKMGVQPHDGIVDLNDCIGAQVKIKVVHRLYAEHHRMVVE